MKLYKNGTFMWALEKMNQGKKVRRPIWRNDGYIHIMDVGMDECKFITHTGNTRCLGHSEITATDWEIYQEKKKTLFDKRDCTEPYSVNKARFFEKDVKESIKDFMYSMGWSENNECVDNNCPYTMSEIYDKLQNVFGSELIK